MEECDPPLLHVVMGHEQSIPVCRNLENAESATRSISLAPRHITVTLDTSPVDSPMLHSSYLLIEEDLSFLHESSGTSARVSSSSLSSSANADVEQQKKSMISKQHPAVEADVALLQGRIPKEATLIVSAGFLLDVSRGVYEIRQELEEHRMPIVGVMPNGTPLAALAPPDGCAAMAAQPLPSTDAQNVDGANQDNKDAPGAEHSCMLPPAPVVNIVLQTISAAAVGPSRPLATLLDEFPAAKLVCSAEVAVLLTDRSVWNAFYDTLKESAVDINKVLLPVSEGGTGGVDLPWWESVTRLDHVMSRLTFANISPERIHVLKLGANLPLSSTRSIRFAATSPNGTMVLEDAATKSLFVDSALGKCCPWLFCFAHEGRPEFIKDRLRWPTMAEVFPCTPMLPGYLRPEDNLIAARSHQLRHQKIAKHQKQQQDKGSDDDDDGVFGEAVQFCRFLSSLPCAPERVFTASFGVVERAAKALKSAALSAQRLEEIARELHFTARHLRLDVRTPEGRNSLVDRIVAEAWFPPHAVDAGEVATESGRGSQRDPLWGLRKDSSDSRKTDRLAAEPTAAGAWKQLSADALYGLAAAVVLRARSMPAMSPEEVAHRRVVYHSKAIKKDENPEVKTQKPATQQHQSKIPVKRHSSQEETKFRANTNNHRRKNANPSSQRIFKQN